MFRAPVPTLTLVAAFASGALGQETKQPAVLPHMEDIKTAPLVYPKEPANPAARHVDSTPALDVRKARVDGAVGPVRHALDYPLYDVDAKGTQWVRGATYKASFDSTGATYIPFLGSRAPRNHPVTMHVSGITAAGTAVEFDAGAAAARDGATVSFDRGSVVEQYEIGRDAMEQRFVFNTLPARGEIVVTLDIETDLDVRGDADGVRFENERGHARYGRATALDAAGHSVAVEERLQDGRVQLVVPATFVATAELPLVIDPYVSTFVVDQDTNDDSNADVAFVNDPAALVVYEYAFSAADHDIYSEKYISQVYQGQALIDISIDDWRAPRVAANDLGGRWLCVAEVGTAGNRDIMGRTINASTLALGAVTTFSGTEIGDKHAPDVGGDPYLVGPTYFLVVWQREYSSTDTDIHARLVSSSGTPQGTSVIFLENSGGTLDSRPSVSKTDGSGTAALQNWNVVWQHEASSTDDDVQGARVHWDGTITDATFTVAGTAANERFPTASEPIDAVGSQPRPWLSVYTLDSDLRFRAWDGTSIIDTVDLAAGLTTSLSAPDVTTDGRQWMVAYTSRFNVLPFPDTDVRALSISSAGGSLYFSENSVPIAISSSENETRPRIAAPFTSSSPYRAYIAYDADRAATGLDVLVGAYDSTINAGAYSYCFGTNSACPCGNGGAGNAGCASSVNPNGAVLTGSGHWFVSDDSAVLTASGMPATASALYFQGTSQSLNGAIFGDGLRCATGSTVRLATKTSVGGMSHYPEALNLVIHLKGAVPAAGGWRYYQVWYRNSGAFCTASTFNLTNGVARLWAP